MDMNTARAVIKKDGLSDTDIALLVLKAQRKAANHHFWGADDNPTDEELQRFYDRYEMEIYDLAKAMISSEERGGLVSYSELGVNRTWAQSGEKSIETALSEIPPKTYIL